MVLVVKLFNVIQQSQASVAAAAEETRAGRGAGKPTLPAPVIESKGKRKGKNKDNIVGRAKESGTMLFNARMSITDLYARRCGQGRFFQHDQIWWDCVKGIRAA